MRRSAGKCDDCVRWVRDTDGWLVCLADNKPGNYSVVISCQDYKKRTAEREEMKDVD